MTADDQVEVLTAEVARLRAALVAIHNEGRVCDTYEICTHVACRSSYAAWAIADEALYPQAKTGTESNTP